VPACDSSLQQCQVGLVDFPDLRAALNLTAPSRLFEKQSSPELFLSSR
jgi:hypothetical protein